eukprot:jgi/Orpsp1_1/1184531/evm.model.c7180000089919.1
MVENEKGIVEAAKEWSKGDKEGEALVKKLETHDRKDILDYCNVRYDVMKRYNYHAFAEDPDYNSYKALFFNPYYSLLDLFDKFNENPESHIKYLTFASSPEFDKFSLLNRTEFPIPYYNILGDKDYQTNYIQAEDYFNKVKAPRKKLYIMKNMTHGLLAVRSGEFSNIMHEIAKLEQNNNSTTTM